MADDTFAMHSELSLPNQNHHTLVKYSDLHTPTKYQDSRVF